MLYGLRTIRNLLDEINDLRKRVRKLEEENKEYKRKEFIENNKRH